MDRTILLRGADCHPSTVTDTGCQSASTRPRPDNPSKGGGLPPFKSIYTRCESAKTLAGRIGLPRFQSTNSGCQSARTRLGLDNPSERRGLPPFKENIRGAEILGGFQAALTILRRCVDWIVQKVMNQRPKAPMNAVLMENLEKASGVRNCTLTYRNRWMVIRPMELGAKDDERNSMDMTPDPAPAMRRSGLLNLGL